MIDDEILDAIIEELAVRNLTDLSNETRQAIYASVKVSCLGVVTERAVSINGQSATSDVTGCVKMCITPGGDGYSHKILLEAILHGLAPGTGFSGFTLRGRCSTTHEGPHIRTLARTNRYNVWAWGPDHQF